MSDKIRFEVCVRFFYTKEVDIKLNLTLEKEKVIDKSLTKRNKKIINDINNIFFRIDRLGGGFAGDISGFVIASYSKELSKKIAFNLLNNFVKRHFKVIKRFDVKLYKY